MIQRIKRALTTLIPLVAITAVAGSQGGQVPQGPVKSSSIGGLTFSPLIYRVQAQPGDKGVLDFDISGSTSADVRVRMMLRSATFKDWTYESQLDVKHSKDASGWFSITQRQRGDMSRVVTRGQKLSMKIPYQVPRGIKGVYWAMITFEPRPVGADDGIDLRYEIPIIFNIGKNPVADIRVGTPKVGGKKGEITVDIPVENKSGSHAVIGANIELKGALTGRMEAKAGIRDRNLLPGTKRYLPFKFTEPLNDGTYRITGNVDFGSRRLPQIYSEFTLKGGIVRQLTKEQQYELTPVLVEPGGFNVFVAPGGQNLKSINFMNVSNRTLSLRLSTTNIEQSASGTVGLGTGKPSGDLSVIVEPVELTIPPKGRAAVRVTVRTSAEGKGDQWFGVAITERDNAAAFSQQLLGVVSFKNTLKPKLEISEGKFTYDNRGNPIMYSFNLKNSGNSNVSPGSRCGFTDKAGGVRAILDPKLPGDAGMLPGTVFPMNVMLPVNLPAGEYEMTLAFDYAAKGAVEKRIPVIVKPAGAGNSR